MLADATTRRITQEVADVCLKACEAPRAHFGIAATADATTRVIHKVRLEASEASRSNFSIAAMADTATTIETIRVTCEAMHSNLLTPSIAHDARRRGQDAVDDVFTGACETTRTNLFVTLSTDTATAHETFCEACEAAPSKFLITSLTDAAAVKELIEETCCAMLANLFEAPLADDTTRVVKVTIHKAGEAALLRFAPTYPTA